MPEQTFITVAERITDNLATALKGIRTINGYSCDVTVERNEPTEGNQALDGQAVLTVQDPEEDEETPIHFQGWKQPFQVICTRIRPESDETPIETLMQRMYADVVRAATADITQGGLAHDTMVGGPAYDLTTGANAGNVTATITVHYRTYYNNPFRSAYEEA